MSTNISGLSSNSSSGLDVTSTVDQLMYVERAPERLMQKQQSLIDAKQTALQKLKASIDSLEDVTDILRDSTGPMNAKLATSSNTAVFVASASQSAVQGTHTVIVERLATASSVYTDPIAIPTTFVPGDLVLSIGTEESITFHLDAAHASLQSAADYINSQSVAVKAQVITDTKGSRLALLSNESGAAGNLRVVSSPEGLGFNQGAEGLDSKIILDGVPIFSSSNKVSTIPGVDLELTSALPGTQLKLSVTNDIGRAKQAIRNFVSSFNSVVSLVNEQFTYSPVSKSAGALAGDSSVRGVQSVLLSSVAFHSGSNGAFPTLKSIGIDMSDDGTLAVNDATLDSALQTHPAEVSQLFQGTAADGFGNQLQGDLHALTDETRGTLSITEKGLENTSKSIDRSIEDFEVRMDIRKQILTAQYDRINTLLQQFTLTQQQLAAQFGSNR